MLKATLKRIRTGDAGIASYEIPKSLQLAYQKEIERSPEYNAITISRPHKPRTTGEKSQSHHFNGHCQQIAQETGNDFETVKMYVKTRAISRGYPFDTLNSVVVPWSETRIDTIQCGYAIDECHMLAADLGIMLIESED